MLAEAFEAVLSLPALQQMETFKSAVAMITKRRDGEASSNLRSALGKLERVAANEEDGISTK